MRCEVLCTDGFMEGDSTFSALILYIFVLFIYSLKVADVAAVQLILKSKIENDETVIL